MTALSVNLNKIALLRNQRDIGIPSVVDAARVCIDAGADGITVHPRPDERHIRRSDVYDLAGQITVEFNVEGNPFPDFMRIARDIRPAQCTLVPDDPGQSTSDHGWDLARDGERLAPIVAELKQLGIRVSLFMNPEPDAMADAKALGADRVELYTEPYAAAFVKGEVDESLAQYAAAAASAQAEGLGVNAGHDLNLHNLPLFCTIPGILECSIGHALIADALMMGLADTVRAYRDILSKANVAVSDTAVAAS